MKRTPLRTHTRLSRGKPMPHRQAPIRPRATAKPGASSMERAGREIVYARSGRWCEIQIPQVCRRRAVEWHHRRNRSQGGSWAASNGLHVCRWCHREVTDTQGNRAGYETFGWIVPGHADPVSVSVSVWYRQARWVWLDDQGGLTDAPEPEEGSCRITT